MDAVKKVGVLDADDIKAVFDMLPTIQPERQKGEWIEISSINHTYKCSECGRLLVNITDGSNNVSKHYPYCHCGADMRGEQE
jgi:DNA-directed RNA polymerase subunit RPC12/RpoP